MAAFTSTRAGALYVLDTYNALLAKNGQDLQASLETLTTLLDADRYDELVNYVYDMLEQYIVANAEPGEAELNPEAEANAIACYLQDHARPKLVMD